MMSEPSSFYRWRPHPWHGLSAGSDPPRLLHAYIEITPFDTVKYEVDKETGYLRVDRPQRTSSLPPTLYGFVPRTYCGERVAALSQVAAHGDGDPLDICVFSERPINHAEILLNARVVGGLLMVDHGTADDKLIAVLEGDPAWGDASEVSELPKRLIERLQHYFATYKSVPDDAAQVQVQEVYDFTHAARVIDAALADYAALFAAQT